MKRLVAACAAAASLSAFGLAGSALAVETPTTADTSTASITLNAAEGNSLDGHNFTFYRLGSYGDITTSDGKVTGFTVNKVDDTVDAKIATANKTAGVAADTEGKITGFDAIGTLVKKTGSANRDANSADSQKILREEAKLLATSLGATDSGVTGKKVDGTGKTMTVDKLDSGLYLIVDDHGSPMIVGTAIDGKQLANSNLTLGSLTVKSKTVNIDKKVAHDRGDATKVDSETDNKAGSASWSVGDTVEFEYTFTLPNKQNATQTVVTDTMAGLKLVGEPTYTVDGATLADKDGVTTAHAEGDKGFTATFTQTAIDAYENHKVTVTYKAIVTDATRANQASSTVKATTTFYDGKTGTTTDPSQTTGVSDTDTTYVNAYDLNIKKTTFSGKQPLKDAGFKVQIKGGANDGKWVGFDKNGTQIGTDKASAKEFTTDDKGLTNIAGLGAGDYYVEETRMPANVTSLVTVKFNLHISDGGVITVDTNGNLDPGNLVDTNVKGTGEGKTASYTVDVSNVEALTQLPQTGGLIGNTMIGVIVVAVAGGVAYLTVQSKKRREAHAL